MKKLNFGIIGTGRIAGQFAEEASENSAINLAGVSARNYEKTKDFAEKHNIDRAYSSVEELLNDEGIDAIYVASFHPTHFPYTMRALEAGKHVLCEKPAVLNVEDMEKVVAKAREKNLLFTEAITMGFNPVYQEIKKEIAMGAIGEVVHVESSYGSVSSKVHKHNPKQAGGALYDIGIYNIFLTTDLLGVPVEVSTVSRDNRWGVEGSVSFLGKHSSGATSSFYATMDSISGELAKIIGTEGIIEIHPSWTVAKSFTVRTKDGKVKNYKHTEDVWLGYEIEAFASAALSETTESPVMTYEKSLNLHRTIDEIKRKLGFTYEEVEATLY